MVKREEGLRRIQTAIIELASIVSGTLAGLRASRVLFIEWSRAPKITRSSIFLSVMTCFND